MKDMRSKVTDKKKIEKEDEKVENYTRNDEKKSSRAKNPFASVTFDWRTKIDFNFYHFTLNEEIEIFVTF
mgnify:FL=1